VRLNGQVVRGDTGEAAFVVLTFRDVTRQKEAETLFETMFQAVPTPISVVRLTDMRYLDVNQAFLRAFGYDREDIVGRALAEVNLMVEGERRGPIAEKLKRREPVGPIEVSLRRKSGEVRRVLADARTIDLAGELCSLGTFVDITKRKEAEARLKKATANVLQNAALFSRSVVEQLESLRTQATPDGRARGLNVSLHAQKELYHESSACAPCRHPRRGCEGK